MGDKNLKQRKEIEKKYKWDIEAMYPEESKWEKDLQECLNQAEAFTAFQGHLTESARTLADALQLRDDIWLKLEHAFVYAHMKKDEDNRESKYQAMDDKCNSVIANRI